MKFLSRKERGLGRHDAPLKIQWMKGYDAFAYGKLKNPYSSDTMMYREWERGYIAAYYDNLDRGIHEVRRRSKGFYGQKKQRSEDNVRGSHRDDVQAKRVREKSEGNKRGDT
tara:strand:- start:516 stop:851 length:336 start_codon:yes stop_codon:yes gene_type:complete